MNLQNRRPAKCLSESMLADIDDFIDYLSSEKGLALNTLEAYKRDTIAFLCYVEEKKLSHWVEIDQTHVIEFIALKKMQKYASASLYRNLVTIKVLFRFLKRENKITRNITLLLDSPKLWQLIPDVLTEEEMVLLLEIPNSETMEGARDKAILEMLYASGLRVSELCQLKIHDVDDVYVRVQGKGGKERIVPIGKKAIEALDHYLSFRNESPEMREEALFVNKRNKPINRIRVWNLVKAYAKKAGIPKKISPHTFRHTFATHLLNNKADLRVIQEMLGHSNINSTDRYTHLSHKHMTEAFQAFHPRG